MASWQAWKNRFCATLVLGVVSTQVLAADPVLSITATPDPATVGSMVGLDVLISGISDLFAFQYTLSFDPTVLQASNVTEGAFMATGGATFFNEGSIDNALGSISFTFNTLIGPGPGVSGSGVLAHINFNAVHAGSSALTFSDTLFLNSQSADVTVQIDNRVLQAVPEPATALLLAAGIVGLTSRRRKAAQA